MVRKYVSQARLDYVTEARIRRELNAISRQIEGVNRTLDALEKSLDDTWDHCQRIEKDIDDEAAREKVRKKDERDSVQSAKVAPSGWKSTDEKDWHNDDVIFGDV
jgi:predicted  nucleic acid-binding Zn-ribbon protein